MSMIPGYGEEDNAFYERAIKNYPSRGEPRVGDWPDRPQNGVSLTWVGPVRVTDGEGRRHQMLPYPTAELHEIVDQGRHRPRALTQDESRLANAERASYADATRAFERWASSVCGAKPVRGFVNVRREYVP
jgi:hypothetical protein